MYGVYVSLTIRFIMSCTEHKPNLVLELIKMKDLSLYILQY